MTIPAVEFPTHHSLALLSRLLLQLQPGNLPPTLATAPAESQLLDLNREEFEDLVTLAQSHHVIVRGLETYAGLVRRSRDITRTGWVVHALEAERERIRLALRTLHDVCTSFEESGLDVLVIKSLDHWPDFGSDIDLYTNGAASEVSEIMTQHFNASVAPRSWGDRLAHKWNFILPGLPEPIEVHIGHLGQMGEQSVVSSSLSQCAKRVFLGGYTVRVPLTEHRLAISVLQRMYRHMNFRLCDIVDTAGLADISSIDYARLQAISEEAGIWEGVATYLAIVSDYTKKFRGFGLTLPDFVQDAARFGGHEIFYARGFLRVPIMPHSARLYGSQLAGTLKRGELQAGARLSLLPWLATAALAKQKMTGSDKGIW